MLEKKNIISSFVFLTLSLSLVLPDGYSIGGSLLFLTSLLFLHKSIRSDFSKDEKWLFVTFVFYGLSLIIFVLSDNFQLNLIDEAIRFILIIPVMFLLLNVPIKKIQVFFGLAFGSLGAFGYAIYERVILAEPRSFGHTHGVMFGDMSMLLGLLSFVGAVFCFHKKNNFILIFFLFAGLAGLFASILSGARGAWLVAPFAFLLVLYFFRDVIVYKKHICLIGVILLVSIWLSPQLNFSSRVNHVFSHIQDYQKGKVNSSVGHRMDLWKAAFFMIQKSFIFGVGQSNVPNLKNEYAEKGLISERVLRYSHAHNDYLEAFSVRGFVGFLLLLSIYLVPLYLFYKKMKLYFDDLEIRSYAFAGMIVPISYMVFGLTDTLMGRHITIVMYLFLISFFWASVRWAEKKKLGLA